jgi:hypothetical protein
MRSRTRARLRTSPDGGRVALCNINVVDSPAFTGDAVVTAHPPAQDKLFQASTRKTHHSRVDKSGRVTGPCLPPGQGIATATVDRAVVTAENKRATGSKDVVKRYAVIIADLQHPAIEPVLKIEVVAERYLHRASIADQCNTSRKKLLVAGCGRIIYERSIGRCICGWRRHSRIRGHPSSARPSSRQRRWRHAIEKLR